MQGQGWYTIEELQWGDAEHPAIRPGALATVGPGAYKLPSMDDVPRTMNVTLMKTGDNPKAGAGRRAAACRLLACCER